MAGTIHYYRTAERPSIALWWQDDDGSLIDFSGYAFTFKLGKEVGTAASFSKTTGITGTLGSGVAPTGTANVVIGFTAAELDAITAGYYIWQLRATTSGVDRIAQGTFVMHDVLT